MLQITKSKDANVAKAFAHKIADIPGGVTISTAELGGSAIKAGTPLSAPDANGLVHVVKTAVVVTAATATDTNIEVAKGSHFKIGDFIGNGSKGGEISAIDKTDPSKDVITVKATLGVALKKGDGLFQSSAVGGTTVKHHAKAVAGENYTIEGGNQFNSAWVIAVVYGSNVPALPDAVLNDLKGVHVI
jgi:hypothetical protein